MSITDELRHEVAGYPFRDNRDFAIFEAIADRIDAVHQKAEDEWRAKNGDMWLKGYAVCREELMEGHPVIVADLEKAGWVRLPVDADGEPIRIGDVMEWPTTGETFEVVGIGDGTLFYIEDGSELADWTGASTKRHYHAPTVEDVLREFAERYLDYEGVPSAGRRGIGEALMDEYATKLRLAEGEDA